MGGPSTNGLDVGFPFGEASSSLGMSYAGFPKLKQELPAGLVTPSPSAVHASTSRPPWALPPTLAGASVVPPKLASLSEFGSHPQHFMKQDHHGTTTTATTTTSSPRFHELPFYESQVNNLYKSSLGSSAGAFGGSVSYSKERSGGRPYPLQYNGGSLVLDHHRGELINLSKMTPQEILDAKALAASKSHSEAERRRRERINNHLNTLRGLLPSTTKTDKASLLAEVIEHVKELKRQAAEIAEGGPVPTDVDELKVDTDPSSSDGNFVLKASLCCEDRPDLLTDLTKALKTLKLKTLKAEIATLGGRVKNVLLIGKDNSAVAEAGAGGEQERPTVSCVQDALRAVIERSADLASPSYGSKRQKMNSSASMH